MAELGSVLEYFRELNFASTLLRLTMAMLFGGLIGLERERKRRAAGFRTYMLVCLGAALAMLLGQYEELMITTNWAASLEGLGVKADVARFGAQVVNGIGFLGAGTIIVTRRNQIKGLTTAAGLWASAIVGLAHHPHCRTRGHPFGRHVPRLHRRAMRQRVWRTHHQ